MNTDTRAADLVRVALQNRDSLSPLALRSVERFRERMDNDKKLTGQEILYLQHLVDRIQGDGVFALEHRLNLVRREAYKAAVETCGGNINQMGIHLGEQRTTVHERLRKMGLHDYAVEVRKRVDRERRAAGMPPDRPAA